MVRVAKIGHIAVRSADPARLLAYYSDVLELYEVGRDADTIFLGTDVDHHAVSLHRGDGPALDHLAFQVAGPLDSAGEALDRAGVTWTSRTDPEPGIAELLVTHDPDGNELHLYEEVEHTEAYRRAGVRPQKLGHVCYFVRDVQETTAFYERALGFRWSDWIADFFVFLRCNRDHHSVNLLRSERNRRIHHIAFELRDWAHVQLSADWLAHRDFPIVWGPGRHGPGHNIFTYHYDPDGNVVELFCELDVMADESLGYFEPRPWHADCPQRPKVWALAPRVPNSWGPPPPEGFLE